MSSINTMRGLLVAGAAFAAVVAAFFGLWSVVFLFAVGVAAHGALTVHLRRGGPAAPAGRPPEPPPAATSR